MIKKIHIIILPAFFLVALICLFCFFNNKFNRPNSNEKTGFVSTKQNILKSDKKAEKWKTSVAEQLYEEFCQFYNNMYNDDFISGDSDGDYYGYEQAENNGKTGYSRFMAADRLSGILDVYGDYLSKEKLDYVKSKRVEIYEDYVGILINFKYSNSGLHIITVKGSTCNADEHGKFLANQIRGISDENNFLEEVFMQTDYSMVDVFIENLSPNKNDIYIEPYVVVQDSFLPAAEYKAVKNIDDISQSIFNKYGRICLTTEKVQLKNGSWNLFCFEPKIWNYIIIKTSDEELKL